MRVGIPFMQRARLKEFIVRWITIDQHCAARVWIEKSVGLVWKLTRT